MSNYDNFPLTEPVLLSVEDAAKVLGVHRATVFVLIRDDLIHTIKIGRRRLIPMSAIHEFIDRQRVGHVGA